MTQPDVVLLVAVAEQHKIPRNSAYYHAKHGVLAGVATKRGRQWVIPAEAVEPYVEWYRTNTKGKGGGRK